MFDVKWIAVLICVSGSLASITKHLAPLMALKNKGNNSVYFLVHNSLLDMIKVLMVYNYLIEIVQLYMLKLNHKYSTLFNIHWV